MFENLRKVEIDAYNFDFDVCKIATIGRWPTEDSHALIYLPGLTASKDPFLPCLRSYWLNDYMALAIDPLGIGDSSRPDPNDICYTVQQQAILLNAILDSLSYKSLTLISHSWGEAIALAEQPRELHSYVSLAGGVSGAYFNEGDLQKLMSKEVLEYFIPVMEGWGFNKEDAALALVQSVSTFIFDKENLETTFKKLDCPRYLIRGEYEPTCTGIDGCTEKIVIRRAGHNVATDQPKVVARELSDLFRR